MNRRAETLTDKPGRGFNIKSADILRALADADGCPKRAAEMLGCAKSTIYRRAELLRKYGKRIE